MDGGNIVRTNGKVIMCDEVFIENPAYNRNDLLKELEELVQVDIIIFIPTQPKDFIEQADGMVRFITTTQYL